MLGNLKKRAICALEVFRLIVHNDRHDRQAIALGAHP